MAEWISLREMSRRRGVTLRAVQKAIEDGRISPEAVRRDANRITGIEWARATADWAENTDLGQALKTGTFIAPPPAVPHAHPAAAGAMGREDDAVADLVSAAAESHSPSAQLSLEDQAVSPLGDKSDSARYYDKRTEIAAVDAVNKKLDLAVRVKMLGRVDDFQRAGADAGREVHDGLMRLIDRLSPLLAAESDELKVRALLSTHIREVLNGLADRARRLAAA